jgi:putative lipoprotein
LGLALPKTVRAQAAPDRDPWWGPDKAAHLAISSAIAATGYGATACVTESRPVRVAVGAGTAVLLGGLKELVDLTGAGHASWKDFTWDVVGAVTGVLVAYLLDVLVLTALTQAPSHPVTATP